MVWNPVNRSASVGLTKDGTVSITMRSNSGVEERWVYRATLPSSAIELMYLIDDGQKDRCHPISFRLESGLRYGFDTYVRERDKGGPRRGPRAVQRADSGLRSHSRTMRRNHVVAALRALTGRA